MKTLTRTILLLIAPAAISNAAILTVDNRPSSSAMFNSFVDAYAVANDGDTILLAGSSTNYTGRTIHKRLTIIGPGYFHNENGIPGTNPNRASITLTLASDPLLGSSSGTKLLGLSGDFSVQSNLSGVVIDKCLSQSIGVGQWLFASPVSITRCNGSGLPLSFSAGSTGSIIRNSIVGTLTFSTTGINADRLVITNGLTGNPSTSISNSIFVLSNASSFIRNSTSVSNCMAVGFATLPEGGGNINGQLVNNIFLNTGSDDGKWRLKAGSPALGAGTGGSDMGAFGGPNPYVLSGLPGIPRITRIVATSTVTSTSGLRLEVNAQGFAD